jgi:dihydrodipicolinate synthase/N-acetylneuraminate lyase
MAATQPYGGVFPVVPTIFAENGDLDLEGQQRTVDFLVDAGSNGLCVLANWSEQFALSDDEREQVTTAVLERAAGRVPVIVTTSHFATRIAVERSRRAQAAGAAMVMLMPPYHGATIRAAEQGVVEHFQRVSDAISIPIMIQDAPMSNTPLPAALLAELARKIANVGYFKIEVPGAADKLRALVALGGAAVLGPWDGEEAITLIEELDAGATGTMPSGVVPEALRRVVDSHKAGRRDEAVQVFERYLPLINYENKQMGIAATKVLLEAGGIIKSAATRHPLPTVHPATRDGFVAMARRLDALVLRWAT